MSFGLFNNRSTYQTDYVLHQRSYHDSPSASKAIYPKIEKAPVPMQQKDVSTMKCFQPGVYVPFDLFFRPKECVTTNPFKDIMYQYKDKSNEFVERLAARKARKRVFMIPQISLDDVDQHLMYKKNGLADNIYTSDWKIATEFSKEFSKSTYQTDYVLHQRSYHDSPSASKAIYPKIEKAPVPMQQKDVSTMKCFQPGVYVPFDLFFRPKECVTTNPFKDIMYQYKDKSNEFVERLAARKARKRVFMIPQISLDDVDQHLMYKKNGLADNIYTSDWKIATEFSKEFSKKSKPNVTQNYKPRNVNFKAKDFCVPIEPGLQRYREDWERYQLRNHTGPINFFWSKNRELGKCSACERQAKETLSQSESFEIAECLAEGNLRSPYQLKLPGYCGFIPKLPRNIKPRRVLFSRTEPWLSTTMEAQGVYKRL